MFRTKNVFMVILVFVLLLAGCSKGADKPAADSSASAKPEEVKITTEPLTMQFFQSSGSISDTEFKTLIADPVKKKYPNITLELVRESANTKREQLIASDTFPDLVFTSTIGFNSYLDLNLLRDLNDPIKKAGLDLGIYEKRAVDSIKAYGDKGQMYALPFSINFGVLYYNKDIFDRAGVSYPQEGVTWEDMLDIGRKIAGKDNKVKVIGTSGITRDYISLLMPVYDAKTGKAMLNTDEWKWMLQYQESLSKLPDNRAAKGGRDGFVKDQTMAMYTSYGARIGELEEAELAGQGVNWDMQTFPVRKDAKVQGMETESHILAISSTAKHPVEAFEIIKFLTTNDEVQTKVAKMARVSSLKDDKYKKDFGTDLKTLKGKNVQAIFKNKYGISPVPTKYDALAEKAISDASAKFNKGELDVNSALREADEAANKAIAAAKAGEGK